MIAYVVNQLVLAGCNLLNVRLDAYRILRHKGIAHGINFSAYAAVVGAISILQHMAWYDVGLICVSAFCNRQLSFDIPLNLRRGLKWDYVSEAKPPKAILDRIEICVFGDNGRAPVVIYGAVFIICILTKFFI